MLHQPIHPTANHGSPTDASKTGLLAKKNQQFHHVMTEDLGPWASQPSTEGKKPVHPKPEQDHSISKNQCQIIGHPCSSIIPAASWSYIIRFDVDKLLIR